MNYIEFTKAMKSKGYGNSCAIQLLIKKISKTDKVCRTLKKWIDRLEECDLRNQYILQYLEKETRKDDLINMAFTIGMFEKHLELKLIEDKDLIIKQIYQSKKDESMLKFQPIFKIIQSLIEYITLLQTNLQEKI